MALLDVKNLTTRFHTMNGLVSAVNDVSFYINEQEVVGIVGESGCGKSVTQLSIMQLIPTPPGEIVSGEVIFDGQNILTCKPDSDEMCQIRGGKIGMIFQEPMTSLNPVLTISQQLTETMRVHQGLTKEEAREKAVKLLELLGIPDAAVRINSYPHQFSGGMRQRVMIAMAISCNPKLVIADEPTTAVDVTTQAQLLDIMSDMVQRFKTALIIVTHNMGVVARHADRIYVMYAGRIVESGTSEDIFGEPSHPYTVGLLKCIPRLDVEHTDRLSPIPGMPPNLINMDDTCAFKPRCAYHDRCRDEIPPLRLVRGQHYVRCNMDIKRGKSESL
jgi:oligopeptide/dipeptide ABC transporter ATP-binding protein